jgi:hypothetical protein
MIRIIGGAEGDKDPVVPKAVETSDYGAIDVTGQGFPEYEFNNDTLISLIMNILEIDRDNYYKLFGKSGIFSIHKTKGVERDQYFMKTTNYIDNDSIKKLIINSKVEGVEGLFNKEYFLSDFNHLKDKGPAFLLDGRQLPLTFVMNLLKVINPEVLLEATKGQLGVEFPFSSRRNSDGSVRSVGSEESVDSVQSFLPSGSDEDDRYDQYKIRPQSVDDKNLPNLPLGETSSIVSEQLKRTGKKDPVMEKKLREKAAEEKAKEAQRLAEEKAKEAQRLAEEERLAEEKYMKEEAERQAEEEKAEKEKVEKEKAEKEAAAAAAAAEKAASGDQPTSFTTGKELTPEERVKISEAKEMEKAAAAERAKATAEERIQSILDELIVYIQTYEERFNAEKGKTGPLINQQRYFEDLNTDINKTLKMKEFTDLDRKNPEQNEIVTRLSSLSKEVNENIARIREELKAEKQQKEGEEKAVAADKAAEEKRKRAQRESNMAAERGQAVAEARAKAQEEEAAKAENIANSDMTPLQIFTLSIFNYIKLLWKTQLFYKSTTVPRENVPSLIRKLNVSAWRRYYNIINLVSQNLLTVINEIKTVRVNNGANKFIDLIKVILESVDAIFKQEDQANTDTSQFRILTEIGEQMTTKPNRKSGNILLSAKAELRRGMMTFMKTPGSGGYCQNEIKASSTGEIKDCCDGVSSDLCKITNFKLLDELVKNPQNIDNMNEIIRTSEVYEKLKSYPEVVPLPGEKESPNTETFVVNINSLFKKAIPDLYKDQNVVKRDERFEKSRKQHYTPPRQWGQTPVKRSVPGL